MTEETKAGNQAVEPAGKLLTKEEYRQQVADEYFKATGESPAGRTLDREVWRDMGLDS